MLLFIQFLAQIYTYTPTTQNITPHFGASTQKILQLCSIYYYIGVPQRITAT